MKRIKTLFIIVIVFSMTATVFAQEKKEIKLADLWKNFTFWQRSVYGLRSMNDGIHYSTLSRNGDIEKFSYLTGNRTEIIVKTSELKIDVDEYEFNENESKLLFQTGYERIYRRSFTADYYVYDLKSKELKKLSNNGKQQMASFSSDNTKIAFVRDNNIFIKDLISNSEKQITNDGKFNEIINGIPDWVYEEEFEFNKAYEWMPDGKKIAYIKFDESEVKMFGMTVYAGEKPKHDNNILYPENQSFKYPKAGESNSIVSVNIYNLETDKTTKIDLGDEKDIYIPRIRTTKNPDILAIFKLNRLQNKFELITANVKTGDVKIIYTETNKYYIDASDFDNLQFLDDGEHFVMTSERDSYKHLYLHDMNGREVRQLTKGHDEVTEFIGFDAENKIFYYQAVDKSPLQRSIFKVNFNGKKKKELTKEAGTNDAKFSSNFKYYINYFSNSETPRKITLYNSKGKLIRVLEDNKKLKDKIPNYGGVNKEFFTFKTSEGIELNAFMVKPPNFDKNKKYPVIVNQYSGPNSQEVLDSWDFGWNNLLAQKGIIMVCVDPRGTGGRGEEFRKMTYLQLGKYETIDLIETAKYLNKLEYINSKKIGIWGWSYGGFMTSLCMTKGADYYSAGIAVAPVTNWRYYDNIYTERFMRTPQENPEGYDDNSPINFADKLKGDFLIVHGSADDNVHLQNTTEFTEALVQANVQFKQFIYTNRNHSIYGGNTRYHLYTMMLNFWEETILK